MLLYSQLKSGDIPWLAEIAPRCESTASFREMALGFTAAPV